MYFIYVIALASALFDSLPGRAEAFLLASILNVRGGNFPEIP